MTSLELRKTIQDIDQKLTNLQQQRDNIGDEITNINNKIPQLDLLCGSLTFDLELVDKNRKKLIEEKKNILENFRLCGGKYIVNDNVFYNGKPGQISGKRLDSKTNKIYYSIKCKCEWVKSGLGEWYYPIPEDILNIDEDDPKLTDAPIPIQQVSLPHKPQKLQKFQSLMVEFLTGKDNLIFGATGVHYIVKEDIEDAKTWPEEFCEQFLLKMGSSVDAQMCPWCYIYKFHSSFQNIIYRAKGKSVCTYGDRHGMCDVDCAQRYQRMRIGNSKYAQILLKINGICKIPGITALVIGYKQLAQSMLPHSDDHGW